MSLAIDAGGRQVELFLYPIASLAAHEALNGIEARYERCYAASAPPQPGASAVAAIATAVRDVLIAAVPASAAAIDARYAGSMQQVPADAARDAGVQVGAEAAAGVLANRGNDPNVDSGVFALHARSRFRPPPPYGVALGTKTDMHLAATRTAAFAADYNEVKWLGRRADIAVSGCDARSAEQTAIARFWVESCASAWNRIARTTAGALDGWQLARTLALLHMAVTDSQLAAFEAKSFYDFWRPVQASGRCGRRRQPGDRAGAGLAAGADDTEQCRLSVGARQRRRRRCRGAERNVGSTEAFTTTSSSLTGVARDYSNFEQAAAENALSGVLIGFHFRHATEAGRTQGRTIGEWAVASRLRALQQFRPATSATRTPCRRRTNTRRAAPARPSRRRR